MSQDGSAPEVDPTIGPSERHAAEANAGTSIRDENDADLDAEGRSEREARRLADSMPHIVWTATADGHVDYFNGRWYEYTGQTPEEAMTALGWRAAVHPDDLDRLMVARGPAVDGGKGFQSEVRIRNRDGQFRWHIVRSEPVSNAAGQVVRRFGTATDIDDQWRSQQEIVRLNRDLKARLDELEALFETIPISIAIAEDRSCARIRANAALERLLEMAPGSNTSLTAPPGEAPTHHYFRRDGRTIPPMRLPMQVAAEEGRPVLGETLEAVFDDGRVKLIHGNAAPLFDEEGRPRGAVGAFLDLTEWRRVEAELANSEEQLRLAVEATDLGLFDRDLRTGVLRWSPRTREIFGLSPDEPVSVALYFDMIHPEDRSRVIAAIDRALDPTIADDYDAEYRCIRTDGATRWIHSRGRSLFEGHGDNRRAVRFVGTLQDITARKEAEAQLTEAKEAAETANRAKDRFLATLSHELRTPLAPVVTAVTLLELTPGMPPEARDYLAMIRRNIALETRLIDDLLDLSRVISGKLRLDCRPSRLNDLADQVMDIVGGEVQEKGLTLETTLRAHPDLVNVDPARIQQVVWNLVKNATKFTPPGGTIRVSTRTAADGQIEIEVRDTGTGIPPETLPHIFDPFEQGDPSITRQFGGLGLGLSIAKAVVDRHGGTIRAQSDGPGRGSSFVVSLPRLHETSDHPEPVVGHNANGPASQFRVLLVEDHVDTALATIRLLERTGYHVAWADGVAAALEMAGAQPFDVVVSDLGLPDGSGYEVMQQLRDRHDLPGIALSGFGMEGDILRSRQVGFVEHLVKPIDVATLDRTIRRVARSHHP